MPTPPPAAIAAPAEQVQPALPVQNPVAPPSAQPAAPIAAPTVAQAPITAPTSMPQVAQPMQPIPQAQMAPPPAAMTQPPVEMGTDVATQNKALVDRLAALEDQNAKLLNLLQTQVAPKIAEYQAENIALKERVVTLNKRLVNMETSLNKMSQLLQDQGTTKVSSMLMGGPPPIPTTKALMPKMVYTVQAIIPGRAWLKSEAGDTVTVAEGDVLKNYGRITKIDPYDGVVEIDTGNKIIALSYGTSGD